MRRRILLLVVGMTVLVVLAFAVPLASSSATSRIRTRRPPVERRANDVALYLLQQPTNAELTRY